MNERTTIRCHHWWLEPNIFTFPACKCVCVVETGKERERERERELMRKRDCKYNIVMIMSISGVGSIGAHALKILNWVILPVLTPHNSYNGWNNLCHCGIYVSVHIHVCKCICRVDDNKTLVHNIIIIWGTYTLHVHNRHYTKKMSPVLTWKYLLWKSTDIEEPSNECNDVHHNDLGHEELERDNLYQVWKEDYTHEYC